MDNKALIDRNEKRWNNATFKTSSSKQALAVAKRLVAGKDRYLAISNRTGVPWYIIAVIHERESSQRWDRSIAQGDRWDKVSVHVPKGRGPFTSFEDAAYDALVNCAPHAAQWKDWSAGGAMTLLELYNGLGYANKGLPSPYIWSGTNQYKSGKYVADGIYDPDVVDSQLGCAVLISAMQSLDPAIGFNKIVSKAPPVTPVTPDQEVSIETSKAGPVVSSVETKPASHSTEILASITGILTAMGAATSTFFEKAFSDWKILAIIGLGGLFGYTLWRRSQKADIKGIIS